MRPVKIVMPTANSPCEILSMTWFNMIIYSVKLIESGYRVLQAATGNKRNV
jgi:hypothetical protein